MTGPAVGVACLEYQPADGVGLQRVPLDTVPFLIGRGDEVGLQLDSARVSREHAAIVREAGRYRVEDLGSTNGTFVNGQRIERAVLHDGDLLMVADVALSFSHSPAGGLRDTVTQVLAARQGAAKEATLPEIIRAVRRLQEAVVQGAFEVLLDPIVSLDDNNVFGYEALDEDPWAGSHAATAGSSLCGTECRLTARWRQLRRAAAIEAAARLPRDTLIFVNVDPAEIGNARFPQSLRELQARLAGGCRIVVEVPAGVVIQNASFQESAVHIQEMGMDLAVDDVTGADILPIFSRTFRPRFVKLAQAVTRAAERSHPRQKQIKALERAAKDNACELIADGVRTKDETVLLRQMGCRFGQGPLYGGPQPLDSLAQVVPPKRREPPFVKMVVPCRPQP